MKVNYYSNDSHTLRKSSHDYCLHSSLDASKYKGK